MLGAKIGGNEPITRFARHSSQYSEGTNRVRHNLFLPPASMRLSVFRTSDMPDDDIWPLGDTIVLKSTACVRARADLTADRVREVGLELEAEPTPHPRHADIVGWPGDDKGKLLETAKSLAVHATLVLRER